jgi:hypothetical protein
VEALRDAAKNAGDDALADYWNTALETADGIYNDVFEINSEKWTAIADS